VKTFISDVPTGPHIFYAPTQLDKKWAKMSFAETGAQKVRFI
jgi:hypothetical protein